MTATLSTTACVAPYQYGASGYPIAYRAAYPMQYATRATAAPVYQNPTAIAAPYASTAPAVASYPATAAYAYAPTMTAYQPVYAAQTTRPTTTIPVGYGGYGGGYPAGYNGGYAGSYGSAYAGGYGSGYANSYPNMPSTYQAANQNAYPMNSYRSPYQNGGYQNGTYQNGGAQSEWRSYSGNSPRWYGWHGQNRNAASGQTTQTSQPYTGQQHWHYD